MNESVLPNIPMSDAIPEGEDALPLGAFSYQDDSGEERVLSLSDEEGIVHKIVRQYEQFEQGKSHLYKRWERVERCIKALITEMKKDRFYGMVPYGKQSAQTLVAHFWGRSLQSPKTFFGVQGQDEQSQEMAPLFKEFLMRHCEKDRVRQKMDQSLIMHGVPKGVTISHVGYCVNKQTLRGDANLAGNWGNVTNTYDDGGRQVSEVERKIYEGAKLSVIDPYDFVFDTDAHEQWDSCFKAYRSWWVYEDIAADPNFTNYEDLKEMVADKHKTSRKTPIAGKRRKKSTTDHGIKEDGRIEVIEFHGDIRLPNGDYVRNWTIVVAGRKKLIRFERNPYFINPFVKWTYEPTDDGWGISPLEYILGFIEGGSILLSTGIEAAKLAINPPLLAAEEHFPNQRQMFIKEGQIVKYKVNTLNPNAPPSPMQFNYEAPFPFLQLFESQAEATTGATRQLSGNVTTNDKVQTATEFQGLQVVGNLIIDRVVDLFNLDFKIPIIEKIALINAMFNPEPGTIAMENDAGVREFQEISPEVYYGNYEFTIEDNKSESERKQGLQEKIQLFQMMMADPDIAARLKRVELAKELWRDFGYGSPGKYFMDNEEMINHYLEKTAIEQEVGILAQKRQMTRLSEEGMLPNAGPTDPTGNPAPQEPPVDSGPPPGVPTAA